MIARNPAPMAAHLPLVVDHQSIADYAAMGDAWRKKQSERREKR